ncbi:MAG: condensation domain-containing protein [Pseudomonadota bacterium]
MAEAVRALGQIETAMAAAHEHAAGTTQGVQGVRLRGRFEADTLRRAMERLHARYQALRCTIRAQGDGYCFVEGVPFESVELLAGRLVPAEWHATMARELERLVDPAQALWGASLLSDDAGTEHLLVLRYHHAIFDGDSFNPLLEELLGLCDALTRGEAPVPAPVPLGPAIDSFLKPADPPGALAPPAPAIPHAVSAPLAQRRTGYHRIRLDAAALQALKARCKAAGLELNSLLGAGLAVASHEAGLYGGIVDFKTAVSLRACLPDDSGLQYAPGCYLAVADTRIDATSGGLHEVAAAYQRALFGAVMRRCMRLRSIPPATLRAGMQAAVQGDRFGGFGLTNLGVLALRHAWPAFEVTDYLPLARRLAGNHAFALHAVEFRGELLATWVYTEPLLDAGLVGRIADRFATALTQSTS